MPKRAGLPNFRFHDLRQTCVKILLSKGANPELGAYVLGHASVTITLAT